MLRSIYIRNSALTSAALSSLIAVAMVSSLATVSFPSETSALIAPAALNEAKLGAIKNFGTPDGELASQKVADLYYLGDRYALSRARHIKFAGQYPASPLVEKSAYYIADTAYRMGLYGDALIAAETFALKYPSSEYLGYAHFFRALSLFKTERYTEGLTAFGYYLNRHRVERLDEIARVYVA
ncbi:MAG: outer membrane protein assembly factor BamD, partial [Endomicrobiia bacterium]|nr:outer membrane protein assembly factor BamD [Endomicrobiia bacterium]